MLLVVKNSTIVMGQQSKLISILAVIVMLVFSMGSSFVNAQSVEPQTDDDFLLFVMPAVLVASRSSITTGSTTTLSQQEVNDLTYMREEEKLARDVYRTLYSKWSLQIFNNISNAEQEHMDSLRSMIVKFGIDDPVKDDSTGSFNNSELAALYQMLITKGMESEEEAIGVGKEIEILDISDLEKAISVSSNEELIQVYERLMSGSYSHLDAFNSYGK
ncbi:MAG: ferritin [Gammaproteobacteria bacterium]|nr:MAG: ferritin [Gammaproteobacteria bacterium]